MIGHRNPDTDAICSAIAYANLLSQTRIPEAQAACCGPPNARTEWVLKNSGVPRPSLITDVRLRAHDVFRQEVVTANPADTVFDAYFRMTDFGIRSMPVIEENNKLLGMLSLTDVLKLLIPRAENDKVRAVREVRTTTENIRDVLDAETVNISERCSGETEFLMMVAASSEPVMQQRIQEYPADQLLIITGDRVGVQLHAVEAGVRCLVITSGFKPSGAIVAAAKEKGVAILVTQHDTASTTQLIRGSRPIEHAVSKDYIKFDPDVPLNILKQRISGLSQSLFPICNPTDGRLVGVFSRTDLLNPNRPKLIMVDHNEFSQAVAGAEEADILEVMDHHRLSGNLVTREPIQFINKTVGSTCTIVARSFKSHSVTPTKGIALCMCAGIVSDTLNLTSPTATEEDARILKWLAEIAEIDVDLFTEEFFNAGSVLRSSEPAAAIGSDRKEYTESGYKVSISQLEEIGLSHFWPVKEALYTELENLVSSNSLDIACLLVTDINRNNSLLLVCAPEQVESRVQYPLREKHLYELASVVSRKKQLFPWLSSLLAEVPKEAAE